MSDLFAFLALVSFVGMIFFVVQALRKRPGATKKAWLAAAGAFLVFPLLAGLTTAPETTAETKQEQQEQTGALPATPSPTAQEAVQEQGTGWVGTVEEMKAACEDRMISQFGHSLPITFEGQSSIYEKNGAYILSGAVSQNDLFSDINCVSRKKGSYVIEPLEPNNAEAVAWLRNVFTGTQEETEITQEAAPEPASSPEPGVLTVVSNGYFGCTSKDVFKEIVGYAVQKDTEAFKKLLGAGLITGECATFTEGETVYLEDTAIFSGMIQVRKQGDLSKFWTNIEAAK